MCRKIVIPVTLGLAAAALVTAALLFYFGVVQINNPSRALYPVRGVDVSSYQGNIDWDVLAHQGISFAFLKATEGSSFTDPYFLQNWANASKTHLRIGAYHFFSFESSGADQAAHFIETVPVASGMLPPVIDVEFYGGFGKDTVDAARIRRELRCMIDALTDHYGTKPILYATKDSRGSLVSDDFDDCDLWFRSVYSPIDSAVPWTFWQYSNRTRLNGTAGREPYIDMNVFRGTAAEFAAYPAKPAAKSSAGTADGHKATH